MKSSKKKSNKRRSKIFDCQEYEYLNWNFPVAPPPMPNSLGLPKDHYDHPEQTSLESICGGVDESQDVELYDGTLGVTRAFVDDHEQPVGQLQWNDNLADLYTSPGNVNGVRWCSGTLVSKDLFLTAGHCFDPSTNTNPASWVYPRHNGTNQPLSAAEVAGSMHVNFNYQRAPDGTLREEVSFAITELVEYRLGGLDYALIRLDGNPGDIYGWTGISEVDADVADMLCIIQHPAGVPKRIEAGPLFHLHDTRLGYDSIDTLGGSSGSGVLRESTGLIVGVHTNGGCTPAAGSHNHGVRISSIRAVSPIVPTLRPPVATLKFLDDPIGTLKFIDDPIATLKFRDDPIGTLKFADDPIGTLKFADDRPPNGTLKFIDDVKRPALDKIPASDFNTGPGKRVGSDSRIPGIDPGRFTFRGREAAAAPFILSTPHHSTAWANSFPDAYQAKLHELTHTIQQYAQELNRLQEAGGQNALSEADQQQAEQLYTAYQQLTAEYERLNQVDAC